jgi:hypothetical protein
MGTSSHDPIKKKKKKKKKKKNTLDFRIPLNG